LRKIILGSSNFFDIERTSITSSVALPAGKSTVSFEFRYHGGGAGKGGEAVLFVDNQEVGKQRIERTSLGASVSTRLAWGATQDHPSARNTSRHFRS